MNFKNLVKIALEIIRYLYRLLIGFVGISNPSYLLIFTDNQIQEDLPEDLPPHKLVRGPHEQNLHLLAILFTII